MLRLRNTCRRCREKTVVSSGDIEASEQLLSPGVTVVSQASLFFYEGARAEGGGKKSLVT